MMMQFSFWDVPSWRIEIKDCGGGWVEYHLFSPGGKAFGVYGSLENAKMMQRYYETKGIQK